MPRLYRRVVPRWRLSPQIPPFVNQPSVSGDVLMFEENHRDWSRLIFFVSGFTLVVSLGRLLSGLSGADGRQLAAVWTEFAIVGSIGVTLAGIGWLVRLVVRRLEIASDSAAVSVHIGGLCVERVAAPRTTIEVVVQQVSVAVRLNTRSLDCLGVCVRVSDDLFCVAMLEDAEAAQEIARSLADRLGVEVVAGHRALG